MVKIVMSLTFVASIVILCAMIFAVRYYCVRQSEIYRQQGIEISAFDVLMGIKPNERVIQIKEK